MRYKLFPRHTAEMETPDDFVIPEIPDSASTREIGIIMIQTIGGLARQFNRANEARDARDRKRSYTLSGVAIGLLIDVALSLLAFKLIAGLNQANVTIAHQQGIITSQQKQLAVQATQIHDNQLDACATSNKTRTIVMGTWDEVLNEFLIGSPSPTTVAFVKSNEADIAKAYKQIDCKVVYGTGGNGK